jgi:DNA replication licensing factor MCM5
LRNLDSSQISKIIVIQGIITSTSKTAVKTREAVFECKNCGHEKRVEYPFGLGRVMAPSICDNQRAPGPDKANCGINSYDLNTDKCLFYDNQIIKLQEAPENIPTGEMPRTFMLTVDRFLTDKVTPGNRVKVVGILSISGKPGSGGDAGSSTANKRVKDHV